MNKFYKYIALIIVSSSFSFANVNLLVINEESGDAIPYVKVYASCFEKGCKDTLQFDLTNKKGVANLKINLPFIVKINHLGYNQLIDTLYNESELTIVLKRKEFFLDEVVTTGQYTPRSTQKSVYQINSVSSERIEAQKAVNLRELMTNEMNIKLSNDNILGSSMSINGLTGQNVKIMIDGVPVIGRLNGNVDVSQINLNNAERVEIIEGPMSAMYGTDALGGVVNIITKDYFNDKFKINANSYYESVGTYNFDGSIGYNFDKNNILISGGRNFFKGFSPVDTSRFKQWKPKEQYFTDWQFNRFMDKSTFRYSGKFFYDYILNRGNPRAPYRETAFDDHYRTYRISNTLSLKGEFTKDRYYELQADYSYYERRKNTYFKDLITLQEILTADPTDQDTSKFDGWMFRGTYSHDNAYESISYQLGFDINLNSARGDKIKELEQGINDFAVFSSLQYKINEDFVVQPALRVIYNTKYDAPLIPSLNIKNDISDYLTIRASYARGFRSPSIQELYFLFVDINHNIQGNTDLKAETSHSFNIDLNIHGEMDNYAFKIEPSFFYNDVSDLITLANVKTDLYSYINIGSFKSAGYGLSLSYIRTDLSSKLGFSFIGKTYSYSNSTVEPDMVFNPEVVANFIYSVPFFDLKFALFYKYTGRQTGFNLVNDTEYEEYSIEDYHIMDINLSRDLFDDYINLSIGIKNLFDVVNINRSGVTGGVHSEGALTPVSYGRIVTAGIRFNLK